MSNKDTFVKQDSLSTAITKALSLSSDVRRAGIQSIYTEAYLQNPILKRLIDYKIEKATGNPPIFYGDTDDSAKDLSSKLYRELNCIEFIGRDKRFNYDWVSFWTDALTLAEVEGNAYVIIGENSSAPDTPLPDNAEIEWLAFLEYDSVIWQESTNLYTINSQGSGVRGNKQIDSRVSFHPSRVIQLYGIRVIGTSRYTYNRDLSTLAPLLSHYAELEASYCNTRELVKNHSFFLLARRGLTGLVTKQSEMELSERLKGLLGGLKNLGGLLIDKDKEEATIISRNYGGLDALIQINLDFFVSQTGFPRSFVTGIHDSGRLSTSAKTDAQAIAGIVRSYQNNKYKPAIAKIANLKAKEIGLPEPNITFVSTYEPDTKEEAEIKKLQAETEYIKAQMEVLKNPPEPPVEQLVNKKPFA